MVLLNCCAVPSWRMPNMTYTTSIDILNKPTNPGALLWAHEFASWEDPGWTSMEPILALKWHADFHIIFRENLNPSFLTTRWMPNLMGSSSRNSSQQKPLTKVPRWTSVVYSFRSVFCAYRLLGFTIQQRNGRWRNHNWPRLVFTGNQVKDLSALLSFWFIRQNICNNLPIFRWLNVPKDQCVRKNLKGLRHRILKQCLWTPENCMVTLWRWSQRPSLSSVLRRGCQ